MQLRPTNRISSAPHPAELGSGARPGGTLHFVTLSAFAENAPSAKAHMQRQIR